jgi:hypothetical protein
VSFASIVTIITNQQVRVLQYTPFKKTKRINHDAQSSNSETVSLNEEKK